MAMPSPFENVRIHRVFDGRIFECEKGEKIFQFDNDNCQYEVLYVRLNSLSMNGGHCIATILTLTHHLKSFLYIHTISKGRHYLA